MASHGEWTRLRFKLYLIKEFQRLKDDENRRLSLAWNLNRTLSKLNYRIHTDAVKAHLIPPEVTPAQAAVTYANEADLLNVALFGMTAKLWRDANPKMEGNMRDHATIEHPYSFNSREMSNPAPQLVQKLWNYGNILRDDGLSYGDYVEQLTFLLFLKMADEQARPPFNKPSPIPKGKDWSALLAKDGDELEIHYRHTLEELGRRSGMLGVIFRKAQNKIQDPAKLRRLIVDLIDKEQWSSLSADVKGDAYEGLLQKNAEDVKGDAGQYFTPRPLIAAMVDVVGPVPGQAICDPACGTGGFLLAAHDYLAKHYPLDRAQKKKLKSGTFFGIELVDSVTRLCAMNLLLHGIGETDVGPVPSPGGKDAASGDAAYNLPVVTKDALAGKHGEYEIVLANPPFGKKSSVTIVNEAGESSKESLITRINTALRDVGASISSIRLDEQRLPGPVTMNLRSERGFFLECESPVVADPGMASRKSMKAGGRAAAWFVFA